jgi:poly(3-hydroxyalkanoate) synthetase
VSAVASPEFPLPARLLLWPYIIASECVAAQADRLARLLTAACSTPESKVRPDWTTPNSVRLDLTTMELCDFSAGATSTGTLICAPFALHDATLADFAPRHSLVQTLRGNGCERVFVTRWRSATKEMRLLTIDSYLAELNVAVDEIGPPVDLVGLCQGGTLALIYAARFPSKVRKLALAGAPVDLAASASLLSITAANLPLSVYDDVIRAGDGRVVGRPLLDLWGPALQDQDVAAALQVDPQDGAALLQRFQAWFTQTLSLPGPYYRQTVLWLFKENRLVEGRFSALGRRIDLAEVHHPLFLLAGRDDELVAPDQLMALRTRVGTKPADIESVLEPCGHLGLFMGARALAGAWSKAARWLAHSSST